MWTFPSLKTRFQSISKSKFFHNGKAHFSCFANWKRDSWESTNQTPCGTALHISVRLKAWKHDSRPSANQPHCWTALPIFQRFAAWKCHSWQSLCWIDKSSNGVRLVHLVYLTITYQLVKLFGAALKKGRKKSIRKRYCWNEVLLESWRCGNLHIVRAEELSTLSRTAIVREVASRCTRKQ